MAYADYEFYTESFFGNAIAEADFPRLSSRASDFIDYYTQNKSSKAVLLGEAGSIDSGTEAIILQIKKACCAVAEAMQIDDANQSIAAKAQAAALASETGEKKSETVGSWSASYTTAADYIRQQSGENIRKLQRANYASIAAEYLTQTGLLYRGGDYINGQQVIKQNVIVPKFTLDDEGNLYVDY